VVDDEEGVLDFLDIFLTSLGWKPQCTSSVKTALATLEKHTYFLVLTDIAMPDMDGYEFVHALRERHVPSEIALMTGFGYNPQHTLVRIRRSMHLQFYFKPFDRLKISEGIQNAWTKYHQGLLTAPHA